VVRVATLDDARRFGGDFVGAHSGMGCLIYGPDGGFIERIAGSAVGVAKRRPSRGRSAMLAALQLIPAGLLVWWDASRNFGMILPTLLAARLVYGGLLSVADAVIGHGEDRS